MNLYKILLPKDQTKLTIWKSFVLDVAGGFTQYNVAQGLWRSTNSSYPIRDLMVPFEVSCNEITWKAIILKVFVLFPREEAIFWAQIGEANIVNNPYFKKVAA